MSITELPAEFSIRALPGRITFAPGRGAQALAEEVAALGLSRALVIAAPPERELAERLTAPCPDRVVGWLDDVRPHVPVEVAESARAEARRQDADALISVGGGSTTGLAKAIALELDLPIVAVPTTYAGSEVTPVWGMTEGGVKTTGRSPSVLPRAVIYDAELTRTLPLQIAGPSAINAIAHCVEALYAPGANPLTSLIATEGIGQLAAGARALLAGTDEAKAREQLLYGAYLAGRVFAEAGSSIHHAICHVLGGRFDLPHAPTHAAVLPAVMSHLQFEMGQTMDEIAEAMGEGSKSGAQAVFDLSHELTGAPGLGRLGLSREDLPESVELVTRRLSTTPRPLASDAVAAILDRAFAGERPPGR